MHTKNRIDKIIWPFLNTGMTVRAIAAKASSSTTTVGRSHQRWGAAHKNVSSIGDETAQEVL